MIIEATITPTGKLLIDPTTVLNSKSKEAYQLRLTFQEELDTEIYSNLVYRGVFFQKNDSAYSEIAELDDLDNLLVNIPHEALRHTGLLNLGIAVCNVNTDVLTIDNYKLLFSGNYGETIVENYINENALLENYETIVLNTNITALKVVEGAY